MTFGISRMIKLLDELEGTVCGTTTPDRTTIPTTTTTTTTTTSPTISDSERTCEASSFPYKQLELLRSYTRMDKLRLYKGERKGLEVCHSHMLFFKLTTEFRFVCLLCPHGMNCKYEKSPEKLIAPKIYCSPRDYAILSYGRIVILRFTSSFFFVLHWNDIFIERSPRGHVG